jgi:Zn-dependent protease
MGPLSNFSVAILLSLAARFASPHMVSYVVQDTLNVGNVLMGMACLGIIINLSLGIFNLLPIPPLDGSHLLEEQLPGRYRDTYRRIMPFGPLILIGLVLLPNLTGGRLNPIGTIIFGGVFWLLPLLAGEQATMVLFAAFRNLHPYLLW